MYALILTVLQNKNKTKKCVAATRLVPNWFCAVFNVSDFKMEVILKWENFAFMIFFHEIQFVIEIKNMCHKL